MAEQTTNQLSSGGSIPTSSLHLSESGKKTLDSKHYLGSKGSRVRLCYEDEHGVICFSSPASRRLPKDWLELSRWCIREGGIGSKQWKHCRRWLKSRSETTTIVSYSDPSVGHTGALYRACNWIWAPVWHVLREPPTGSGIRGGKLQRAKHRWVFLLKPDNRREQILRLQDESLARRFPWISYTEPEWIKGRPQIKKQDRFRLWIKRKA